MVWSQTRDLIPSHASTAWLLCFGSQLAGKPDRLILDTDGTDAFVDMTGGSERDPRPRRFALSRLWPRRRRMLVWGPLAAAAAVITWQSDACYALAADAYQSVSDSYLIMWIERAGAAMGCF